jgi:thioredoxin reductase (NADPH)
MKHTEHATMTTAEHRDAADEPVYEVAIIGAGPVGIELAVALRRAGVPFIHFDANQIGHTLTWWPRNTNFFSTTERIEIAGIPLQNNHQQRTTGEEYLAYMRGIVEQYDLAINAYERVVALAPSEDGWALTTCKRTGTAHYRSRRVLLAIGDMEYPRTIDIPGEDLPHVSHYFRDPHDYFRQRLLIVGGRNSAVEAALRCWRAGTRVTVSYRRAALDEGSVKHWLIPDFYAQVEAGTIHFLPETTPIEITPTHVMLSSTASAPAPTVEHPADFVFLATGYYGDQTLLREAGVVLEGPNRVPRFDPATMETNAPGLYLAGTVAAGIQQRYTLFIENAHEHVAKIMEAITGRPPERVGAVAARSYHQPLEHIATN